MADDLDENYFVEKEFVQKTQKLDTNSVSDGEENDDNSENDEMEAKANVQSKNDAKFLNKRKIGDHDTIASTVNESKKKRHKKKNITEILKIREKTQKNQPSFPIKEFKRVLLKYLNENLSSVEKNDLNLSTEERLDKMILKRKTTHLLEFHEQFKKKFDKKLNTYLENKDKSSRKCEPVMLVLCSSAIRCIELQKSLGNVMESIQSKKLRWIHAFAKHKKLHQQIEFIQSATHPIHMVFATPNRFMQLIQDEKKAFKMDQLKYVCVDYTHRDCKQKNFFDNPEIKVDFLKLFFNHLIKLNTNKINVKFYLA